MSAEDPTPQVAQRRRHERAVFHEIRRSGPISRARLADRTGLSAQAMGAIVKSLLEADLIEERPMARREGPGAPATGIQLRPDGAFAFGFGLERDSLSGVLVDLTGARLWQYKRSVEPGEAPTDTLDSMATAVRSVLRSPRFRHVRDRTRGLGVAAPGPINLAEGTVVGPPDFPGWEKVAIVSDLETATGLPVLVDNAASAAALGVEWQMLPSHGSFLYCYWGLGIGGGLVIGGEAYRGSTGNVAELGHVVINENGRPCACGGRGSWKRSRQPRRSSRRPSVRPILEHRGGRRRIGAHVIDQTAAGKGGPTDGGRFGHRHKPHRCPRGRDRWSTLRRRRGDFLAHPAVRHRGSSAAPPHRPGRPQDNGHRRRGERHGAAALVLHERLPHNATPNAYTRDALTVHPNGRATKARRSTRATPPQDHAQ